MADPNDMYQGGNRSSGRDQVLNEVLNTDPTPTTMAGSNDQYRGGNSITLDHMLNNTPNRNAMAGRNDTYHGDRYHHDMLNASGTMAFDCMVNNAPNRTAMAGPSNLYRGDVSNAGGTMTLDHILNDTPNRTAMAGPNDLYSDDIFSLPVETLEPPDPVLPHHASTLSSNSFSSFSTRPSEVSSSPIPELDTIYSVAIQRIDRLPTGAILNLLPPLTSILALNNAARSELETKFQPKYLAHLIAGNETRYGRYPRSSDIRLSHLSHMFDDAERHVFALVVTKNDGVTMSVVKKGREGVSREEALDSWVRVVREDGEKEARYMCVPRDIMGNRLDR
jgi:hypothetical protein